MSKMNLLVARYSSEEKRKIQNLVRVTKPGSYSRRDAISSLAAEMGRSIKGIEQQVYYAQNKYNKSLKPNVVINKPFTIEKETIKVNKIVISIKSMVIDGNNIVITY